MRSIVASFLDALLFLTFAAIAFIVLSGGGVYTVARSTISLRSPDNALLVCTALLIARFLIRDWAPLFGISSWNGAALERRSADCVRAAADWGRRVTGAQGARLVVVLSVGALGVKLYFAMSSPGFYSGDDVEIHEMTLSRLLHHAWPIWDLRNPIFPFLFVYPAQWIARLAGVTDVGTLVIAGRTAVAVVSTVSIWLTWHIARRRYRPELGYAVLAAAFVATAKLLIAFGSSELPRPVSTALALSAFALLQRPSGARTVLSGALLGLAACLRFSEAVFVLPAVVSLVFERHVARAAVLACVSIGTMFMLIGVTDQWYWGQAFHSVKASIDFTLVRGLSSRGYQPIWWYLTSVTQWASIPLVALALVGARRQLNILAWAGIPVLVLSALPHKEARYLIPVIPFVCLLAAEGVRILVGLVTSPQLSPWAAPAIVAALVLGLTSDVAHFRLPRSNEDVVFGRAIARASPRPTMLRIEQAWRMGGHLYFGDTAVADMDPEALRDPADVLSRLSPGDWIVVDRRTLDRTPLADLFGRLGYRGTTDTAGSRYVLWRK